MVQIQPAPGRVSVQRSSVQFLVAGGWTRELKRSSDVWERKDAALGVLNARAVLPESSTGFRLLISSPKANLSSPSTP